MGEDMEKIVRIPEAESPIMWLFRQGATTWNRYMQRFLVDEYEKYDKIEKFEPLSIEEEKELKRLFQKKFPNTELPNKGDLWIRDVIWNGPAYISGYIFPRMFSIHNVEFRSRIYISNCTLIDFSIHNAIMSCPHPAMHFNNNVYIQSLKIWHGIGSINFFENSNNCNAIALELFHSNLTAIHLQGNIDKAHITNTKVESNILFHKNTHITEINFLNTKVGGEIDFQHSTFSSHPSLKGCTINAGINIEPQQLRHIAPQAKHKRRWSSLKQHMNNMHLHREEADFFVKELECRALEEDGWRKSLISLYKVFSDYGRGILIPFGWLMGLVVFSTILYKFNFFYEKRGWMESLYLGIKGSIPLLPYDKHLHLDGATLNEGFGTFKITALMLTRAIHMTVAGVFLFLIGLGIRNRLRIK